MSTRLSRASSEYSVCWYKEVLRVQEDLTIAVLLAQDI
jgi:hypothetical protein